MSMSATQHTDARLYLNDKGTSSAQSILITGVGGVLGGTFTVAFNGQTTGNIPANAPSNVMQNALTSLSSIGLGNATVNNNSPYSIYLAGTLGNSAQPMFVVDPTLLTPSGAFDTVLTLQNGGITAFSDAELDMLYDDAKSVFFLAIAYAFDVLANGGAKFNDYTAGQTSEKKSQIAKQLKDRAEWYHQWANASMQVQTVRLQQVPPRVRAFPITQGVPSTSIAYGPNPNMAWPNPQGRWGGNIWGW